MRREELERFRVLSDCDNNYIVLLSAKEPQDNWNRPMPGGLKLNQNWENGRGGGWGIQAEQLVRGLVYRVRENGQFAWEKPIPVDFSYYWDEFPAKVPLIMILCRIRYSYPAKLPIDDELGDLRAYDLRTGRCLFDYLNYGGPNYGMVSQTPTLDQFGLHTSSGKLTFKFVGGAAPVEPATPIRITNEDRQNQRLQRLKNIKEALAENDAALVQAKADLQLLTDKEETTAIVLEKRGLTSKIDYLEENKKLWNEYIHLESEQLK